jgi:hypothetical protein
MLPQWRTTVEEVIQRAIDDDPDVVFAVVGSSPARPSRWADRTRIAFEESHVRTASVHRVCGWCVAVTAVRAA